MASSRVVFLMGALTHGHTWAGIVAGRTHKWTHIALSSRGHPYAIIPYKFPRLHTLFPIDNTEARVECINLPQVPGVAWVSFYANSGL